MTMTPQPGDGGPHWSAAPERSNLATLRLMAWIALRLGRPVARLLLAPITLYFLLFSPTAKRNTQQYLRRALGREPRWIDHYRQVHAFASVVLDRIYLARNELQRFDVRLEQDEQVHEQLAEGHGVFMVGAHIGSFEALHAVGKGEQLPVAMVMYPDNARMIQTVLQAVAPAMQLKLIAIGRPGSTLAIRDWLDGGGLVGVLGDRLPPPHAAGSAGRSSNHAIPFFGEPALFSDGPLRLAQLLRRRVLFMVGLYEGGARYRVRFLPLADFRQPETDPARRETQLQQALEAYVRQLEALCRSHPYNWFNFHDIWSGHVPSP